ncbi:MAG: hypothetical protein ACKVKR_16175, partial [Pseudomonadales bacterium]
MNFKTDTVVKNPSRIMRIPGTISYPDNKKRAKGYIDELVELRINENPTPLVDISQWADLLPKPKTPESLQIDLGYNFLDLDAVKAAALRGQNWHGNMLRLVGSWVAKGFSDQEILAYVQEFTLPGYTQAQTRNELIKMING